MLAVIVNIIAFSFINVLAMLGIFALEVLLIYWQKQGIVTFDPEIILPILLITLFILNFMLFYFNAISQYKWPIKKKLTAAVILLICLIPGIQIIEYILQTTGVILNFIESILH